MLIAKEFPNNLQEFQVIISTQDSLDLDDYIKTVIYNAINYLTNTTYFSLKLIKQTPNFKEISISFPNKDKMSVIIENSLLYIINHNTTYVFNHRYTKKGIILILVELKTIKDNKNISEVYQPDNYTLKVTNNNFTYVFNIPYEVNEVLDLSFLSTLDINTNIKTLQNIYFTYFYPYQSLYHQKLITTLTIYENDLVKESMNLQEGKVINLELNASYKDLLIMVQKTNSLNPQVTLSNIKNEADIIDALPIIKELLNNLNNYNNLALKRKK